MTNLAASPPVGPSTGPSDAKSLQLERLKKAAAGFEQQFLEQLMKPAEREPDDDEDFPLIGGDPATRQFTQMLHSELAGTAAGGLGIADQVVKELAAKAGLVNAAARPEPAPVQAVP